MKLFLGLLSIIALTFQSPALADQSDQLGKLVGEKIELFYTDHAISGHVDGKLVFATPFQKQFGIQLAYRVKGQDFKSEFVKGPQGFAAQVNGVDFAVTKVDGKNGVVEGRLGPDAFKLTVKANEMDGNHYVNPTFEVTLPKSTYTYRLENGSACISCVLKINFVVLSMLRVTGVL